MPGFPVIHIDIVLPRDSRKNYFVSASSAKTSECRTRERTELNTKHAIVSGKNYCDRRFSVQVRELCRKIFLTNYFLWLK